jgi:hypothetical protein
MVCCFALALTSLFPLPASALVSFSGIFADDGSGGDTAEDDLILTNDLSSTEDIFTVVFDLTTAATGTTFEPATWSFVADAGDAAATGFTGEVVTATTLTLTFTDFNAGESLKFTIDLDDNNNVVGGASIAGSTVTATFAITGDVVAVMADAGGNTSDWSAATVPEPNTAALLAAGLIGLAWVGRRRH